MIVIVVALVALGVWLLVTGGSCETYVNYESNAYNFGRCSMSYRLYDDGNLQTPLPRDRCGAAGCYPRDAPYDFTQYEYYCPHNCREYGVSLCDQGRIM